MQPKNVQKTWTLQPHVPIATAPGEQHRVRSLQETCRPRTKQPQTERSQSHGSHTPTSTHPNHQCLTRNQNTTLTYTRRTFHNFDSPDARINPTSSRVANHVTPQQQHANEFSDFNTLNQEFAKLNSLLMRSTNYYGQYI